MKLQITVEIIALNEIGTYRMRKLPQELCDTVAKMPPTERETKSILFVDTFPPRLIDNKAVHRYFPMLVGRTFQEALTLLRDCDKLYMARGAGLKITWSERNHAFLDNNGNDWVAGPDVILSQEKEWYVYSEDKSDQTQAELPDF